MDKQQIKARFFGAHIGCKVRVKNALALDDGDYELCSVESISAGLCLSFSGEPNHAWAIGDNCKLILRPLSSITNEEAIEALTKATGLYLCDIDRNEDRIVAVGVNHNSNAIIWLKTSPNPVGTFIQAWNNIKGHSQPDCHDYLAVDYLRSINICVPFMGLDPVKEGFAVLSE